MDEERLNKWIKLKEKGQKHNILKLFFLFLKVSNSSVQTFFQLYMCFPFINGTRIRQHKCSKNVRRIFRECLSIILMFSKRFPNTCAVLFLRLNITLKFVLLFIFEYSSICI